MCMYGGVYGFIYHCMFIIINVIFVIAVIIIIISSSVSIYVNFLSYQAILLSCSFIFALHNQDMN